MQLSKSDLDLLNRVLNLAIKNIKSDSNNNGKISAEIIELKELQIRIQEERDDIN